MVIILFQIKEMIRLLYMVCADMESLEKVLRETGGFDQLIKEHRKGSSSFWFHISVCSRNGKPRNQIIMNLEKK